jgi:hypothetical protein
MIFHDPKLVGDGIATVVIPSLLIAALLFHWTRRSLRADLDRRGELSAILLAQAAAA